MTDTPLNPISAATCVIRATDARPGRSLSVAPGLTASRNLHYGRIRLDPADSQVRVNPGGLETGLVSLKGEARVSVAGTDCTMRPYDALYVPRETPFIVAPGAVGCDLAEIAAPVDKTYPLRFVAFADVERDSGLSFQSGGPTSQRRINILLGKNIEAGPELATIVHEGDVVLMPKGYHPNVAAPGCSIGFIWMMAANREGVDRLFGVVNVQPEFASGGSGLEKGRADAPTDKAGR
jgi:5-deoxy-glucuronate isomerase